MTSRSDPERSKRRLDAWGRLCAAFDVQCDNASSETYLKRLDKYPDGVVIDAFVEAVDTCETFPRVSVLHELCRKARKAAPVDADAPVCDICNGSGVIYAFRPRWDGELVVRSGIIRRKVEEAKRTNDVPPRWFLVGLACTCVQGRVRGPQTGFTYGPTLVRSLGWALEDQALAARDNVPDMRRDVAAYRLLVECAPGTPWGRDVQLPVSSELPPVEAYDVPF